MTFKELVELLKKKEKQIKKRVEWQTAK